MISRWRCQSTASPSRAVVTGWRTAAPAVDRMMTMTDDGLEPAGPSISIRTLCETAIETQDETMLPRIKAQIEAMPAGAHKTNARRWLAMAHVLVAPQSLSKGAIDTAEKLIAGMPDDSRHKNAALDMLIGLEAPSAVWQ